MTNQTSQRLYRPCVGIMLLNNENYVFVGERIDNPGSWQMPQGGIDEGETIEVAFFREMREEIGTDKAEIIEVMETPLRYDFPPHLQKRLWNGQYHGQEQTWVAARFQGQETDINIHSFDPPEFLSWQWLAISEVLNYIVPFKKDIYKDVITGFSHIHSA